MSLSSEKNERGANMESHFYEELTWNPGSPSSQVKFILKIPQNPI
jgi:hypothetical protein